MIDEPGRPRGFRRNPKSRTSRWRERCFSTCCCGCLPRCSHRGASFRILPSSRRSRARPSSTSAPLRRASAAPGRKSPTSRKSIPSTTSSGASSRARGLPQKSFVPFIQADVAINPGNSGGPLFNVRGGVVGINSQIYSRTGGFMGLSFAIPIDLAMGVQGQLRQFGRVSRGRIGVVIQEVSKELAESFGLSRPAGALVNAVETGGPAEKAGVETGDIILKFDGKSVSNSSELPSIVGSTKPGNKATVEVWRKGVTRELTVTVGELPEDRVASRSERRGKPPEQAANRLGFAVVDLTAEQKRDLKLGGGVIVEEVRNNRRADVRAGDVITAVTSKGQTTEVKSTEQFNKLLGQLERNTTLTLHVRRGESNLFVTVRGEGAPG